MAFDAFDIRSSLTQRVVCCQIAYDRNCLNTTKTGGICRPKAPSACRFGLLHGEGVAVIAHVSAVGLPADLSMLNRRISAVALIGHMRRDFVLARGIGRCLKRRPPDAVLELLRDEDCEA
jgi:hypothetical protein